MAPTAFLVIFSAARQALFNVRYVSKPAAAFKCLQSAFVAECYHNAHTSCKDETRRRYVRRHRMATRLVRGFVHLKIAKDISVNTSTSYFSSCHLHLTRDLIFCRQRQSNLFHFKIHLVRLITTIPVPIHEDDPAL